MTSSTPSRPPHHLNHLNPLQQQSSPAPNASSPPSKRDLKSWWKRFQVQSKHHEAQGNRPQGIFGIPLRDSIPYANVAISHIGEDGKSVTYGYVPIVVAKCGVFLKERATDVEGIFRLSGSEKRIKELKLLFDSPEKYGKGLVWDGYTVHDAANVLRRYLNDLPEPVIPLNMYENFREPLRGHTYQAVGDSGGGEEQQPADNFDENRAISRYKQLIQELPKLNSVLLLYILDLLAVFSAKSDENRMTSENLAAIFQPGLLSHPNHAMAPEEYRLNQCVIIFLIDKQDHFMIGMQGTAADEKTKQAIERGSTPVVVSPSHRVSSSGVVRSASSASAGAESVSKDGQIRRNKSTSSRRSRQSKGPSTPTSPALATTPTGGLARSNTLPSKKSPHLHTARFQPRGSATAAGSPASPSSMGPRLTGQPYTVMEEPAVAPLTLLPPANVTATGKKYERLQVSSDETPTASKGAGLFLRSPLSDSDSLKPGPNKLRKRAPGSANPSPQSSTASLGQPHSRGVSPAPESSNTRDKGASQKEPSASESGKRNETPFSDSTPRASLVPSTSIIPAALQDSSRTAKPRSSTPTSLRSSCNDISDMDPVDDKVTSQAGDSPDKERKKRWRVSRRRDELVAATGQNLGVYNHAEASTSTVASGGYGHRARKSWTGERSEAAATATESETGSRDPKDDGRGPLGWFKSKLRGAKESHEQHKRAKSPPDNLQGLLSRSINIEARPSDEEKNSMPSTRVSSPQPPVGQTPQDIPLPMSPPPIPLTMTHGEKERTP